MRYITIKPSTGLGGKELEFNQIPNIQTQPISGFILT